MRYGRGLRAVCANLSTENLGFDYTGVQVGGGSAWGVGYQNAATQIIPGEFGWEATDFTMGLCNCYSLKERHFTYSTLLIPWVISANLCPSMYAFT